ASTTVAKQNAASGFCPSQVLVHGWSGSTASDREHPAHRKLERMIDQSELSGGERQHVSNSGANRSGTHKFVNLPETHWIECPVIARCDALELLFAKGDSRVFHPQRFENTASQKLLITHAGSQRENVSQQARSNVGVFK